MRSLRSLELLAPQFVECSLSGRTAREPQSGQRTEVIAIAPGVEVFRDAGGWPCLAAHGCEWRLHPEAAPDLGRLARFLAEFLDAFQGNDL